MGFNVFIKVQCSSGFDEEYLLIPVFLTMSLQEWKWRKADGAADSIKC